jgi:mevalonate kinase
VSSDQAFVSKVLLFGEYSVIKRSRALAIPYPLFEGRLKFESSKNTVIDSELKAFCQYLKKAQREDSTFEFDVNSFEFDIGQGLFFDSTIPQGFGVGSSGALCAALVDRYTNCEKDETQIQNLRSFFALLESHFHGSSSGFDPLVSYLNRPILIQEDQHLSLVDLPAYKKGTGCLFLLNTGRARRTEPLVNLFLEKCKSEHFNSLCTENLLPITNNCIESFLEGEVQNLFENFKLLSQFQFENMKEMIPKIFQDTWESGLNGEDFYFKLCGAGGGGFLLGMTRDFTSARKGLEGQEIRPLFYF